MSKSGSVIMILFSFFLNLLFCSNNNGTLCVTETLKNVESVQGPVTISTVSSWLTNGIPQSLLTSNISCTNCVKQTYNVISSQAPTLLASTTSTSLRNTCGASLIGWSFLFVFRHCTNPDLRRWPTGYGNFGKCVAGIAVAVTKREKRCLDAQAAAVWCTCADFECFCVLGIEGQNFTLCVLRRTVDINTATGP